MRGGGIRRRRCWGSWTWRSVFPTTIPFGSSRRWLTRRWNACRRSSTGCMQGWGERRVTPHVARRMHSAIDGRTTRPVGYAMSLKVRKQIEEIFGWMKTVGGFRPGRGSDGFGGLLRGDGLQPGEDGKPEACAADAGRSGGVSIRGRGAPRPHQRGLDSPADHR